MEQITFTVQQLENGLTRLYQEFNDHPELFSESFGDPKEDAKAVVAKLIEYGKEEWNV
jgi:hypothetical protein